MDGHRSSSHGQVSHGNRIENNYPYCKVPMIRDYIVVNEIGQLLSLFLKSNSTVNGWIEIENEFYLFIYLFDIFIQDKKETIESAKLFFIDVLLT